MLRSLQQFGSGEKIVARDFGVGDLRLGAVAAVFRAEAALGIHQKEELHGVAKMVVPHPPGGGQEIEQFDIGRLKDRSGVIAVDRAAGEHACGHGVPAGGVDGGVDGGFLGNRQGNRHADCSERAGGGNLGEGGEPGIMEKECMRLGRCLPKLASAAGRIPGGTQHKV